MIELKNPPIFVTGCARSGTSLVTGIFAHCGAWCGKVAGAQPHNPKGQFENTEIRNGILKPLLVSLDADKLGQKPLPDINKVFLECGKMQGNKGIEELRHKVHNCFLKQGFWQEHQLIYKGAKLCLIWPVWHILYKNPKWIIVRRKDDDIAKSCMNTVFMRAYSSVEGWKGWVDHHKDRFNEMMEYCGAVQLWSEDIVAGNFGPIREVVESTGL
ncbi:unnamed protein product, partial [marine sediment metagenome]